MINIVTYVCLAMVGASSFAVLRYLLRSDNLADRSVAVDSFMTVILNGLAVSVARTQDPAYLDYLLVAGLVGFIGTITVSYYISRRGT